MIPPLSLRQALVLAALLPALTTLAPPASAQPSMAEKSESHSLFERALAEYKASRYKDALPLFQASQQLDPGVGTLMYMGECSRQLGQTASAWGAFKEAATLAVKLGDKREKIALDKAAEIEPTLSYLSIEVPPEAKVDGLEIKRDGRPVPTVLWGTSAPVDPGDHGVEISAPGRKSVTVKVSVKAGGGRLVHNVKSLDVSDKPLDVSDKATAAGSSDGKRGATTGAGAAGTLPSPAREEGPWRTVGFVVGGVGLAGAAVGTVVAIIGRGKAVDAKAANDTPAYNDAKTTYTSGFVVGGIGGAFLVGGVAMVLLSPRESAGTSRLRVAPAVGANGGGLAISGGW